MMFNVGDMVTVRGDLPRRGRVDKTYINDNKWRYRGRRVEIAGAYYDYDKQRYVYSTLFPSEYWTQGCFEEAAIREELEIALTTADWEAFI